MNAEQIALLKARVREAAQVVQCLVVYMADNAVPQPVIDAAVEAAILDALAPESK